ncbi:phosphatase PAP2 family protein [Caulobacter sp. S45]|uniref:acid phosphatase n=1 Tax=Caulobacter sp. S45 TaxID=1641861 RepID=UPI001574F1F0|nr:phosphatase PAP2 family protein [Caulobacter sp. S45]
MAVSARRPTLAHLGAGLAALLAVGPPATGQPVVAPTVAAASGAAGYLSPGHVPDVAPAIGPPPSANSGTQSGDVSTYQATRALQGGPRWALATRDAVYGADAMLQDFSCALGVRLTSANAPALRTLLSRVGLDDAAAAARAKKVFRRPRPFVDHDGPICVAKDEALVRSYSYPSGHSTFSWTVGLALAEVAPDRAAEILGRARAYGESRVVCGVHYESDVQAGRVAASTVFSALQAEPEFQRDLAMARSQLAALRSAGGSAPDAQDCRVEADAVAHPVW